MATTCIAVDRLTLRAGHAQCDIAPGVGGSIARWSVRGQEMLRRAERAPAVQGQGALEMASFPLVPYSNRIGHGEFVHDGTVQRVTPNFPPEPHAIHGTGWTARWSAEQTGEASAVLRHVHDGDDAWPWAFVAEQHISLSEDALTLDLRALSRADRAVPLAFGHHPYFDSAGASLQFRAERLWLTGGDRLPSAPVRPYGEFAFAQGGLVEGRSIDHGYAGWDGLARIAWDGRPLGVEISSDMSAAVVYIPRGGDAFCFEPVPHIINALNLPGHQPPMPVVAPGGEFSAHIQFKVTEA